MYRLAWRSTGNAPHSTDPTLTSTVPRAIKDGLGQFGGVLFASMVNKRFDADPKRWRLISGISQDAASMLEALTPLFPGGHARQLGVG